MVEVRKATLLDNSAILSLLSEMHTENGTIQKVDWFKVSHLLTSLSQQGTILIAVNEENDLMGSIGGMVAKEWYSEEPVLIDYWFYVFTAYKETPAAFQLMKSFKNLAVENDLELKIHHGPERSDKFYGKLGFEKSGTTYRKAS